MMKIVTTLMLACVMACLIDVAHALAEEFPTNTQVLSFSDGRIFSSIAESNNTLIVGLPLMQARYVVFINTTNVGFGEAFKTISLKSGDTIELVEKHTTIRAQAEITGGESRLKVIKTFDGRSFGDTFKTECFIFQGKKTK